ncbi:MAG: hypothetical protein KC620_13765 [Myxococcales bacterium]|nr:hypothetical protein [Myxococcales bacterium]
MALHASRLFFASLTLITLVACGSPEEFPDESDFVFDQQQNNLRVGLLPSITDLPTVCDPRSPYPNELCADEALPGSPAQCDEALGNCNLCQGCSGNPPDHDPIVAEACSAACTYCDRCNPPVF